MLCNIKCIQSTSMKSWELCAGSAVRRALTLERISSAQLEELRVEIDFFKCYFLCLRMSSSFVKVAPEWLLHLHPSNGMSRLASSHTYFFPLFVDCLLYRMYKMYEIRRKMPMGTTIMLSMKETHSYVRIKRRTQTEAARWAMRNHHWMIVKDEEEMKLISWWRLRNISFSSAHTALIYSTLSAIKIDAVNRRDKLDCEKTRVESNEIHNQQSSMLSRDIRKNGQKNFFHCFELTTNF